ncbi:MAG TPA: fatty acid desaturase [Actinomycetota bacterium]|nr:fatty acid desaturase [Actinomycetota bacterium]
MAQRVMESPESTTAPLPGIVRLSPRNMKIQRWVVLALTLIPFAGFVVAMVSLWGRGFTGTDGLIMLGMYMFTGLGVTVGFHRLLTHHSFDTPKPVRILFATAGSMSLQGSVISWVADHRRHHAHSDKPGDPHSPHLAEEDGVVGVLKGLWHAHTGWFFDEERTERERWAPDMFKDPVMVKIDRLFPVLSVLTFVLPAALGYAFTGTIGGAFSALLWGGLVRVFLLHHVTWSVNSICHFFGRRPFDTTDYSTNNWPLAVLSFGESWHNTHHAFPTSAVHGIERWQPDMSAFVISTLEKFGLANNVKRIPERDLEKKKKVADSSLR